MPAISVMMKPSSGMCNMRCDYCFYCDETGKRSRENYGFMTETTLRNIIRRTLTRAEGIASFAFQGGEPTLRGLDFFRKVVEFEKQYNRNGVRIHNAVQTNGTLLDDEWCGFFRENGFLIGLSVDGTQSSHDTFRHMRQSGDSAWEKVMQAAELMDRHNVDYNILTVVNSVTAAHIGEIYRFYRSRGWHWQQYIECLDPLGEEKGTSPWSLDPDTYGRFLIDLFHLWYEDAKHGRKPSIRRFENYIRILLGHIPEACEQRGSCTVQYVCEADGSVYPCDFYMLDEYCLGNFNSDRIDAIDQKRREMGFLEGDKPDEECLECPYHRLCRVGCRRTRDITQDGRYRSYFCPAYKMFFDECLPQLTEIAQTYKNR